MTTLSVRRLTGILMAIGLAIVSSARAHGTAPPPPSNVTNPGILCACYKSKNGNLRLVMPPAGAEPNSCTAGTASSGYTCNPNITNTSDPCFCTSGGPRDCKKTEIYIEFNQPGPSTTTTTSSTTSTTTTTPGPTCANGGVGCNAFCGTCGMTCGPFSDMSCGNCTGPDCAGTAAVPCDPADQQRHCINLPTCVQTDCTTDAGCPSGEICVGVPCATGHTSCCALCPE